LPSAEFHQLGAYSTYDAEKIKWLHDHFTVHGFVEDPAKMFQTGDICLMPYQQDTGFRTKIPEVCGYGMIPAGYGPTFACCPEMRDGFNCIIAETPAQLVEKLAQLQADEPARRRLATNAYQTRRQDFSFAVLLERYRHILKF
jgi:glycosyltransferase involved in cell wall biosynthesis